MEYLRGPSPIFRHPEERVIALWREDISDDRVIEMARLRDVLLVHLARDSVNPILEALAARNQRVFLIPLSSGFESASEAQLRVEAIAKARKQRDALARVETRVIEPDREAAGAVREAQQKMQPASKEVRQEFLGTLYNKVLSHPQVRLRFAGANKR